MTMTRIIRRIGIWWFKRCQRAKADAKARQLRRDWEQAKKRHQPSRATIAALQAHTTARLREDLRHG